MVVWLIQVLKPLCALCYLNSIGSWGLFRARSVLIRCNLAIFHTRLDNLFLTVRLVKKRCGANYSFFKSHIAWFFAWTYLSQ